ncbi:hypothetical protein KL86DPRO_11746 [uncultured delta proteobacterium]|uniref:Uncharacterized protein n=1 Tax=uncultured delta proteobacterium TaxID=34034 RepID=A0A212JLP3_9DELT|nr:hypothetical protein KL86DPRO_11746 [uncultured delta proteobacterium]
MARRRRERPNPPVRTGVFCNAVVVKNKKAAIVQKGLAVRRPGNIFDAHGTVNKKI